MRGVARLTCNDGPFEAARHEDSHKHEACYAKPCAGVLHLGVATREVDGSRRQSRLHYSIHHSAHAVRIIYDIHRLLHSQYARSETLMQLLQRHTPTREVSVGQIRQSDFDQVLDS